MNVLHHHSSVAVAVPPRPRWGCLESTLTRHGVAYHRLVLLEPGATPAEWRLWRLHRETPWMALLAALVAAVSLAAPLGASRAMLVAAGLCLASIGLSAHASRAVRRRAVRIDTCTGLGLDPLPTRSSRLVQLWCVAQMKAAEEDLRGGRCSAVQFEAVWHEVYEQAGRFDSRHRTERRRRI